MAHVIIKHKGGTHNGKKSMYHTRIAQIMKKTLVFHIGWKTVKKVVSHMMENSRMRRSSKRT